MPEAAVEELIKVELLVLAVQVVVVMVELLDKIAQVVLELLIPVVEAVVAHIKVILELVAQAVQVSSSSRPINNEDKWKPKSIGCMESTPQCTC
jgi:hypothetical protein